MRSLHPCQVATRPLRSANTYTRIQQLLFFTAALYRCSEDNMPVFFLALLSETLGWVPSHEHTLSVSDQYDWVQGMSLMEMEIIQAAYRCTNRNGN